MTLDGSTGAAPTRPRRRWPWYAIALLLIVILVWFGLDYVNDWAARRQLDRIIAELDARDPKWRWKDIVAARPVVPDAENGALCAMKAYELRPNGLNHQNLPQISTKRQMNEAADPTLLQPLRATLVPASASVGEARRMAELPRGQFPMGFHADDSLKPQGILEETLFAAQLLRHDAGLLCNDGDVPGALRSCRAIWHEAIYLRGEPTLMSTLLGIACQSHALAVLEHALAHGQITEPELKQWQSMLEDDERYPWIADAIRGERAAGGQVVEQIADGRMTAAQWAANLQCRFPATSPYPTGWEALDALVGQLVRRHRAGSPYADLAGRLRFDTDLAGISRLAPEQQPAAIRAKQPEWANLPENSTAFLNYYERYLDHKARLRCMLTALAVERFRLAEGRWPGSLAELAPRCFSQVPVDVHGGKALNYLRLPDGVLIYSSKGNGQIASGAAKLQFPGGQGKDNLRIRLWDPDKRHLPAAVPKIKSNDPQQGTTPRD